MDICACIHWKQESCVETNISASKFSRLPSTNKDFTLSTEHMCNRIRTRETHPRHLPAGASVTAWPPSAVGPLRLNSEACGEGGRQGGQMGTQYASSRKHKSSQARGFDRGRRDGDGGKLKEHPSSTCHSRVKEKSRVDVIKLGENKHNHTEGDRAVKLHEGERLLRGDRLSLAQSEKPLNLTKKG